MYVGTCSSISLPTSFAFASLAFALFVSLALATSFSWDGGGVASGQV
jgi:hypothetical protein